ncbi:unnamed protein product [Caenorhabditis angaria]|uniref:glutathione-specific gamma-glutamylcyclotransferase n=1 Tax=Caenorhabditis angaria TaxID=860376 RepID=A0A9P1J0L9_9PELO|nr:unnamed protein product [Caenorhabditis angaria]
MKSRILWNAANFENYITIMDQKSTAFHSKRSLYIFGYGSLIWNPGFNFNASRKAYAIGWVRRMYQGNTYHRGDQNLPGRVATLIQDSHSATNGIVFRVDGTAAIHKTLRYLEERECDNGYVFRMVPIRVESSSRIIMALTCVADMKNELYLGPDDVRKMAHEITKAKGCAGPNCEYVLKLAENVRRLFPDDEDEHLYQLEHHIKIAKVIN